MILWRAFAEIVRDLSGSGKTALFRCNAELSYRI